MHPKKTLDSLLYLISMSLIPTQLDHKRQAAELRALSYCKTHVCGGACEFIREIECVRVIQLIIEVVEITATNFCGLDGHVASNRSGISLATCPRVQVKASDICHVAMYHIAGEYLP